MKIIKQYSPTFPFTRHLALMRKGDLMEGLLKLMTLTLNVACAPRQTPLSAGNQEPEHLSHIFSESLKSLKALGPQVPALYT
jgi:hypothetical protein